MSEFKIENNVLKWYYGEIGEVIIPDGVEVIGKQAFYMSYKNITHLVIPDSVKTIEKEAFFGTCGTLKAMYWPHRNLKSIKMPDELAKSLTLASIKSKFDIQTLIYGFLNNPDGFEGEFRKKMIKIIEKYRDETITAIIRQNVLELLINFINLQKNITFDDILHFIEIGEKENKKNDVTKYLCEYRIEHFGDKEPNPLNEDPNQRTLKEWRKEFKIGLKENYAFINKYNGDKCHVIIPGIIGEYKTKIKIDAFNNERRIETVVICDGLEEIGVRAFYGCKKLKKIFIPKSVTKIDNISFLFCDEQFTIYAPMGSYAIEYAIKREIPYKIGMWEE